MLEIVEGGAGTVATQDEAATLAAQLAAHTRPEGEHLIWTGTLRRGVTPIWREGRARDCKRRDVRREILRVELAKTGRVLKANEKAMSACGNPLCVAREHIAFRADTDELPPDSPHITKYLLHNVSFITSYMADFPDCLFTLSDLAHAAGVPNDVARPIVMAALKLGHIETRFEPEYGENAYYPAGRVEEVCCA
jgi:hypothetical protein